jgi:PAS domain S-box-containing protein
VNTLSELGAGRHPGLDVICKGILEGSEFVYPAERHPAAADEVSQVSKEGLAFGSFRVADGLGHMGEYDRMRAQLLKSLRDFSSSIQEPWARPLIARNVARLALGSDNPTGTVRKFWREMTAFDLKNRLIVRRALADALREIAIVLWKQGSYRSAGQAILHALYYDSSQLFKRTLLKRFVRAIFHVKTDPKVKDQEVAGKEHEYLFELGNDSVMTRTIEGRIKFWNRRAEELYGWRKEEAIGKLSHNLLQTEFPKPLEQIEADLVQTGRWEGKLVHATRDGRRVVVESRWILNLKGKPGAVVEINTRLLSLACFCIQL